MKCYFHNDGTVEQSFLLLILYVCWNFDRRIWMDGCMDGWMHDEWIFYLSKPIQCSKNCKEQNFGRSPAGPRRRSRPMSGPRHSRRWRTQNVAKRPEECDRGSAMADQPLDDRPGNRRLPLSDGGGQSVDVAGGWVRETVDVAGWSADIAGGQHILCLL